MRRRQIGLVRFVIAGALCALSSEPTAGTAHAVADGTGPETVVAVTGSADGFLAEAVVDALSRFPGVVAVRKYLIAKSGSYDVIGMDPGGPGLVLTEGRLIGVRVRIGRWFEVWEDHVAVIGRVYAEDFGEGPPEHGMKHMYTVGATVRVGEAKIPVRVIGVHETAHPGAASKIFVPLVKAQQWFDRLGLVSYAVVFVEAEPSAQTVAAELRAKLPAGASVMIFSRPAPQPASAGLP